MIGTVFVLSVLAAGAYAMQSPEPVVPDWLRKDAFALLGSLERAVRKAIEAPAPQPDAVAATAPAAAAAELSRALLERLTEADFQNAGAAVAKALSQTPDDGVLVWPLRAKPSAAVFEVRFVPGAPEGCRRYIVGILKDRWTTTAMPVDKCGIARQAQRK